MASALERSFDRFYINSNLFRRGLDSRIAWKYFNFHVRSLGVIFVLSTLLGGRVNWFPHLRQYHTPHQLKMSSKIFKTSKTSLLYSSIISSRIPCNGWDQNCNVGVIVKERSAPNIQNSASKTPFGKICSF